MLDFGFASEQEIRIELCGRLHAQRLAQNLTQTDLAERAGVAVNTVKNLESKGQLTLENFVRVVMALGLSDDMQPLFTLKITSIAQMEQAEKAKRLRASRKSTVPQSGKFSLPK